MEIVRIFQKQEFGTIHGIMYQGKPWLVGRDVAEALGYVNVIKALGMYVRPEDKMGCLRGIPSKDDIYIMNQQGRRIYPIWINETGVLSLVFHATTDASKRFHLWLTDEIFPSLMQPAEIIEPLEAEKVSEKAVNTGVSSSYGKVNESCDVVKVNDSHKEEEDSDDSKSVSFMKRLEKMEKVIMSIKEANDELLKSNRDLISSNKSMQVKLSEVTAKLLSANNTLMQREEHIKQMRPAVAFTEYYGKNNEAQSADYYASALGISSRKFNVMLVSFGILREVTTKGKNKHRIAVGEWRKCVKPMVRSFYVNVPGKEGVEERKVMENSSSPAWLPAFFPLLIGFLKSYDLLDDNGKFKEKVWDKAREEMKKQCKKNKEEMKQAWAKDCFTQDVSQFPEKFEIKSDLFAMPTPNEKKVKKVIM